MRTNFCLLVLLLFILCFERHPATRVHLDTHHALWSSEMCDIFCRWAYFVTIKQYDGIGILALDIINIAVANTLSSLSRGSHWMSEPPTRTWQMTSSSRFVLASPPLFRQSRLNQQVSVYLTLTYRKISCNIFWQPLWYARIGAAVGPSGLSSSIRRDTSIVTICLFLLKVNSSLQGIHPLHQC